MIRFQHRGIIKAMRTRQIIRANKKKMSSGKSTNSFLETVGEQQKHTFGKARTDMISKSVITACIPMLDTRCIDALNWNIADNCLEDDDGR